MTDQQIEQLIRADRDLITEIVPQGSHVLDLGCGDGSLLSRLIEENQFMAHRPIMHIKDQLNPQKQVYQ